MKITRQNVGMALMLAMGACATQAASSVAATTPFEACFEAAAQRQAVPATLLKAIAYVESEMNPRALNRANRDSSIDYGLMQINSQWLPKLEAYGITQEHLLDPCTNIHVGAWILAENVKAQGWTWEGIGAYNAGPRGEASIRKTYTQKVLAAWTQFVQ